MEGVEHLPRDLLPDLPGVRAPGQPDPAPRVRSPRLHSRQQETLQEVQLLLHLRHLRPASVSSRLVVTVGDHPLYQG